MKIVCCFFFMFPVLVHGALTVLSSQLYPLTGFSPITGKVLFLLNFWEIFGSVWNRSISSIVSRNLNFELIWMVNSDKTIATKHSCNNFVSYNNNKDNADSIMAHIFNGKCMWLCLFFTVILWLGTFLPAYFADIGSEIWNTAVTTIITLSIFQPIVRLN